MGPDADDVRRRLSEPFAVREVKWKPQAVKGNRAMAAAYIDARLVMDRLDEVVGVENWQDSYEVLHDGCVVCRLAVRLVEGGEWVTKTDVGDPSEQPDAGDRLKAAFSDALKRSAVKFGIGRYLYRLPSQWADYDPQKRQFVGTPALPAWAIPAAGGRQPPKGGSGTAPAVGIAVGGAELLARIREKDGKMAAAGRAKVGELIAFVAGRGGKAGYGDDVGRWPAEAFQFAIAVVKEFEAAHPVPAGPGGGHHQTRPEGE